MKIYFISNIDNQIHNINDFDKEKYKIEITENGSIAELFEVKFNGYFLIDNVSLYKLEDLMDIIWYKK